MLAQGHLSQMCSARKLCCYVAGMNLADLVAQCRKTVKARDPGSDREIELDGAGRFAKQVEQCPIRYVLSADLTRLCAELAYSKGARSLACTDLLHVPAECLWIEWCSAPWERALRQYCVSDKAEGSPAAGRRGAFVRASADGRRGVIRSFWTVGGAQDVLASSMEAYFDFDTPEGEEPGAPDRQLTTGLRVYDGERANEDMLARCFRFRYERSWSDYYAAAALTAAEERAISRHVLGTIAFDVPLLLAFWLLLASRASLPRDRRSFERLNRLRQRNGRLPLLDHIEVRAPALPEYLDGGRSERPGTRLSPRLHHVRGHLMRRGSQLYWRVPHLRGSARSGVIRTRTVTWAFDDPATPQRASLAHKREPGVQPTPSSSGFC